MIEPTPKERAKYCIVSEPERLEELIEEQIYEAIRALLDRLGTSAICLTCGRPIYWVHSVNGGRRIPYSTRGVPHTEDCEMEKRPGRLGRWHMQNVR